MRGIPFATCSSSTTHVLDLARMVGHRDLKQLQVYYNETAEEMAKLLDRIMLIERQHHPTIELDPAIRPAGAGHCSVLQQSR